MQRNKFWVQKYAQKDEISVVDHLIDFILLRARIYLPARFECFKLKTPMTIRKATLHDALKIQQLLDQLGYPNLNEGDVISNIKSHTKEGYSLLVVELDHSVVAFIALHWFDLVHWKEKMGRISSFCVDERFRSKGVGKALLQAAEQLLAEKGCAKIEVTSNERRTKAHQFYLDLGYVEDSKRFVKYL